MAEPIANDWKAIRDRMQQIRAERSTFSRPCPECNGLGWVPDFSGRRHPQTVGYAIILDASAAVASDALSAFPASTRSTAAMAS
jgi:hypothetical protein